MEGKPWLLLQPCMGICCSWPVPPRHLATSAPRHLGCRINYPGWGVAAFQWLYYPTRSSEKNCSKILKSFTDQPIIRVVWFRRPQCPLEAFLSNVWLTALCTQPWLVFMYVLARPFRMFAKARYMSLHVATANRLHCNCLTVREGEPETWGQFEL